MATGLNNLRGFEGEDGVITFFQSPRIAAYALSSDKKKIGIFVRHLTAPRGSPPDPNSHFHVFPMTSRNDKEVGFLGPPCPWPDGKAQGK